MPEEAKLFETPKDIFFTLKDITFSPKTPRKKVPFTVKGEVELFGIPFYAPVWAIATVTYPEKWWEEIIPIIGSPEVRGMSMVVGGDFEITFKKGFDREGEFSLAVRVYAGPTLPIDKITLPPFPPVATQETKFIVAGEVPPEEVGFRNFKIVSYSKNGSAPVTPPGVLELKTGDRLTINLGFDHRDLAVTAKIHAAIWQPRVWDPHDEVLFSEKSFSVPASDDWKPYPQGIDIVITSGIAPGKYGLYAKIMGITGGDIFTEYLPDVISIAGPPEVKFSLAKPVATPETVDPGQQVTIDCPVTSQSTSPQTATVKVNIYEGSPPVVAGKLLQTVTSPSFTINPGETKVVSVKYPAAAYDNVDERDVGVEVWVGGQKITDGQWDNIFYVKTIALERLEVTIDPAGAGTVTVEPTPTSTVPAENAWYFPAGTQVYVTAHPNSGYKFVSWSGEMTDTTAIRAPVYPMTETRGITAHFKKIEAPELKLLVINIDPAGAGYVTVEPSPSGGTQHNWQFPYGTIVYVTAHRNTGYTFVSWSGEMKDTTAVTAPVYGMTEERIITAHFLEIPTPEQYTVTISIDPYGAGSVSKSPDKATYQKGEYVTLTAIPSSGYEFDYWSGDVSGYNASISLLMDKNKSVAAHFKKPLPDQRQIVSFAVHAKGPPFPTSYWILMHYDMDGQLDFQSQVTPIETNIRLTGVMSGGYLSVFTSNAITGEWRVPQVDSVGFRATDGGEYTFDINTGIVYMGFI